MKKFIFILSTFLFSSTAFCQSREEISSETARINAEIANRRVALFASISELKEVVLRQKEEIRLQQLLSTRLEELVRVRENTIADLEKDKVECLNLLQQHEQQSPLLNQSGRNFPHESFNQDTSTNIDRVENSNAETR